MLPQTVEEIDQTELQSHAIVEEELWRDASWTCIAQVVFKAKERLAIDPSMVAGCLESNPKSNWFRVGFSLFQGISPVAFLDTLFIGQRKTDIP